MESTIIILNLILLKILNQPRGAASSELFTELSPSSSSLCFEFFNLSYLSCLHQGWGPSWGGRPCRLTLEGPTVPCQPAAIACPISTLVVRISNHKCLQIWQVLLRAFQMAPFTGNLTKENPEIEKKVVLLKLLNSWKSVVLLLSVSTLFIQYKSVTNVFKSCFYLGIFWPNISE